MSNPLRHVTEGRPVQFYVARLSAAVERRVRVKVEVGHLLKTLRLCKLTPSEARELIAALKAARTERNALTHAIGLDNMNIKRRAPEL